jgi:hypothetical protein
MREKIYVDRLFENYDDTPEIRDFKEEITANLAERVKELTSGGLEADAAFEKAASELGDITAIADEAGRNRRNETIGQIYMKAKIPLTKKSALGFTAASAVLLFAAAISILAFLGEARGTMSYYISAVLTSTAAGMYVFFGLTRETAAHYAMKHNRALAYGIVAFLGFIGAGLAVTSFISYGAQLSTSLLIKIIFILPAICAFIYLLATEKSRLKPWLKNAIDNGIENEIQKSMKYHADMVNPIKAARFGVISCGMWILAVAVYIVLKFGMGLRFSEITFLIALAIQFFMVSMIFGNKGARE